MTFIVHFKDRPRKSVNISCDESKEHEVDAAYDRVYEMYPDADYIETL